MDIHEQEYQREQSEMRRRNQATLDAQDFEAIAGLPEGRRLLRRMIGECGIYHDSFTGDALNSAYREGKRAVGLWLIDQFNACQPLYIQLLTEQNNGSTGRIHD